MKIDNKQYKRIILQFLKMLRETICGKDDNIFSEKTLNRLDDK